MDQDLHYRRRDRFQFVGGTDCTHLNLEETKAIVDEAHRRNIMVASHCESTLGMRDCLEAGVDTIEHASTIMPDMVEKFLHNSKALRGYTAVIPTLLVGGAMHEHPYEDTPANQDHHGKQPLCSAGQRQCHENCR